MLLQICLCSSMPKKLSVLKIIGVAVERNPGWITKWQLNQLEALGLPYRHEADKTANFALYLVFLSICPRGFRALHRQGLLMSQSMSELSLIFSLSSGCSYQTALALHYPRAGDRKEVCSRVFRGSPSRRLSSTQSFLQKEEGRLGTRKGQGTHFSSLSLSQRRCKTIWGSSDWNLQLFLKLLTFFC